jgi:hypothetical protein
MLDNFFKKHKNNELNYELFSNIKKINSGGYGTIYYALMKVNNWENVVLKGYKYPHDIINEFEICLKINKK